MEDKISSNSDPNLVPNNTLDPATNRKHQAMLERLSNLHQSRLQNRKSDSAPSFESTDSFVARFSDLKQSITMELSRIEQSPESFSKSDLDKVSALISDLEKLLAENSYYLPSYEVRASLKTVSDLKESLEKISLKLFPRKKFAFKTKSTKQSQPNTIERSETENPRSVSSEKMSPMKWDSPGFRNREDEVLVENSQGKDIGEFTLSDLCGCDVRLMGKTRAIFIHRLRNCKIYAGPAFGSVLIEDVEGCIFVLASHQIRIHNAKGCDFYLRVRSHPIIEDSNGVRFAPYCLTYEGLEGDLKEAKLDEETRNWENVDDFKWLRAVQSPNWSVLPKDERIGSVDVSIPDC